MRNGRIPQMRHVRIICSSPTCSDSACRWDANDPELVALEQQGLLNWSPSRKDDDLFTINLAIDQDAFVVTRDAFRNYQMHVTAALKRRLVTYWFAGSGGRKELFGVSEDDCARVRQAVGAARRQWRRRRE